MFCGLCSRSLTATSTFRLVSSSVPPVSCSEFRSRNCIMASIIAPAVLRFSRVTVNNLYQINKSLNRLPHASYVFSWRRQPFSWRRHTDVPPISEATIENMKKLNTELELIKKQNEQEKFIKEQKEYTIEQPELMKELAEWQVEGIKNQEELIKNQEELIKNHRVLIKILASALQEQITEHLELYEMLVEQKLKETEDLLCILERTNVKELLATLEVIRVNQED